MHIYIYIYIYYGISISLDVAVAYLCRTPFQPHVIVHRHSLMRVQHLFSQQVLLLIMLKQVFARRLHTHDPLLRSGLNGGCSVYR